jgi:hypothetical protein
MKQKRQVMVLVALLLIAGVIWFFYFGHDKPALTADAANSGQNPQLLSVDNPSLHKDGVERTRKTEYKSGGRNIFSREIPPPPLSKQEVQERKEQSTQVPAPVHVEPKVSPLPVKFFGYGTVPNGTARVAFFSDGEDVTVVKEGELLMNRFRILKIGNASLEYEEISSGLRGTASLEEQAGPPSA